MKRLTNILSYLWLLLLMAVTACSDLEEEVGPMHVEEEVELTIQLHVPDMQASTREEMVITENISSIVAIAFDESGALIKKVDAILSDQDHVSHSGTLKIKVPKRTRTIHFLGNYTKNDIEKSITSLETLNNFTTTDATTMPTMRYWGMTTFDGSNINQPVTLYRNMAKLTLTKGKNINGSCYISGFVNRNLSGTIVPSGHAVGDTPTLPNDVSTYTHTADNSLGNVYYLFEHANTKDNPLYIILEILGKYYKVAFASGDTYFPIIRNHEYTITIDGIDAMYAENYHLDAVNSPYPINDLVIDGVSMTVTASPTEVLNESGQTFTVTVTIPEGITELNEPTHDAFDITPPNSLTLQNGKYTVTQGDYEFTFTVNEGVEAGDKTISFSGRGKYLKATGSANIALYDNVQLTVAADPATIYNTAGSTRNVTVTVPQGITTLTIPDATTAEFIVSSTDVTLNNNSCDVSGKQGQTVTFTLALRTDGNVGDPKTVTFNGSGQYKRATGSTTLTLEQAPAQEILQEYELWVENDAWKGSTNYDTFFTWNGDISAGDASNLESTFYDDGANAHKSRHMVMGQNNSIRFTIPDTRYLTLLVASNNGNTPSINLTGTLTDDTWATATSEDDVVPDNYNFGKGEIGTNGRLICYTLPAGTYTLQGSSTSYLLYYLRVSTEKPTMTDIVQPAASDYSLSWSGNNGGYLKDPNNDAKYFVDEEATNFIPTLTYNGLSKVSLSTVKLDVTTDVWTFNNSDDSSQGSMQQDTRNYTEANISSLAYNEGAYTLSGSVTGISGTSYKYATFYDNLQLKSVSFNVKNTVKVALYNSWDSDAQPVTEFVEGGENNILGFKMPQRTLPVNPLNSGKINFTIDNSWQLNQSGAGIYQVEGSNYQIGDQQSQQDNQSMHYHPRTEWTYKMSWNNIPSYTITPTSTTDDVYFSYNGEISKKPTIEFTTTQGAETPLSITLDFYQTEGENLGNNATYNLALGETSFYLKATIEADDAAEYAGKTVTLNNAFSGNGYQWENSNGAIHWDDSSVEDANSNISSDNDASDLTFTINANTTVYVIEWVFVTGQHYKGGDIGFTYNISNYAISGVDGTFNNFTGDTSATIGFTNEPIYLDIYSDADTDDGAGITIASGDELVMKAIVPSHITTGTITFDLSGSTGDIMSGITWNDRAGQSVQFSWPNITLTVVENQRDYYLYWNPTVSDERSATLNFTVSGNYNLNSVGNTSYSKAITVTPNNNQTTGTVVWTGSTALNWESTPINVFHFLPMGTKVTLNFTATADASIELHDSSRDSFRLLGANHPANDDDYISIEEGQTSISFTVNNETISGLNDFANGLNGLIIMGSSGITMTSIVVQYPNKTGQIFSYDFSDNQTINGWGENGKNNVSRSIGNENGNNYLILSNTGGFAQAAIDGVYVPGSYTLTYKIKGNASNSISQVFQYFNDNQKIYESVVDSQSVEFGTDGWKTVTLNFEVTRGCNRLLFDYTDFTGEIYIDDLILR